MNIKKIIAAVLAVATLGVASVASFAAPLVTDTDFYKFTANVNGTPKAGEKFTVDVFVSTSDGSSISLDYSDDMWVGTGCFACSGLRYDKSYVTINATPTFIYEGFVLDNAPTAAGGVDSISYTQDIEIPSGSKIITYEFTVNAGVEAGTYINTAVYLSDAATLNDDYMGCDLAESIDTAVPGDVVLVVKGDAPAVEATKNAETGVITFTTPEENSEIANKNIVVNTAEIVDGSKVTADTRVKVTCKGKTKTFGNEMWEEAGFDGEGGIKTKKIAFGIVFTDSSLKASDFTFEIVGLDK